MRFPKSSVGEKIGQVFVLLGCSAAIAVSVYLIPDARGHGTHEELGFPPCAMAELWGVPCPTCGVTTSFAHMARLEVGRAALVQPVGVIGFALAAGGVAVMAVSLSLGFSWAPVLRRVNWTILGWITAGVVFASWVFEIVRWRLFS